MRPADSTNEEVIAAGKALIESGKTVTGFGLRQQLGGGGAQRLKQIWDEHQANNSPAAPLAAALPESLSAALDSAVKGMAQKFTELAHGIHAEATKAAREAAQQFAKDSGSRLGSIASAEQGVVQILPRDGGEDYLEREEADKKIRVVARVRYYLDD